MQKSLICIAVITALILSIPLLGNWPWTLSDFVFAGALIFGTGSLFEVARKNAGSNNAYKIAAGLALAATFLLIWINGAVGIIGSENNPANLMYDGVLAILFLGALIARFRPNGMARTLYMAAIAQFLVPIIALFVWRPDFSPGVIGVLALNAFFVVMFVGSAIMFRHASAAPEKPALH